MAYLLASLALADIIILALLVTARIHMSYYLIVIIYAHLMLLMMAMVVELEVSLSAVSPGNFDGWPKSIFSAA